MPECSNARSINSNSSKQKYVTKRLNVSMKAQHIDTFEMDKNNIKVNYANDKRQPAERRTFNSERMQKKKHYLHMELLSLAT